ncbi:unnamed protein product [Rhizophagus irregularis]|nr:unnamed protein product [Rhizophagus irregularis]
MYKPIIDSAKISSEIILLEILDQLEANHLPGQEKVLPVGFDCSWSHARNAHQASEEFLYLGDLPGYNYQPVIGFYTVENSRSAQKSENDSRIIHQGNFDGSSRQMEHAILIALLNNIIPILEETDFTLHVCVDGDLETNRTLACIPAVSRIFADLKHVSKNIRKNLLNKKYSRWHPFEQHIIRYFNSCIFSAGLRKKNNQDNVPTEEETQYVQVEGLIRHLLDDHSLCWNDVCWMKNNPELQLQSPTLKNYTTTEIENFRSVITSIFRVPFGQGLVTTLCTSHNEAFNRKILKYLDKRIDYWASYSTRHALAVLDQNDGLDVMISKQNVRNRNTIQQRNEKKFSNDRKELAGFDFDKELVSYKSKTPEQIRKNIFWPSFGDLLTDFDMIIKCVEWIIDSEFIPKGIRPESPIIEALVLLAMKKIFEFNEFREGQLEAIISYLNGKDTFVSMKTGGGKTLCYAISAVCFNGLIIVFSPLKALMEDQKRELIKAGVLCATLYANLAQGACVQEKIFEEIACGLIKVRFVIDEAHCIIAYQDFREAWGRLGILKQHWKLAPIMLLTATCTQPEVDEIRANLTIEGNNFAIIRSSTSHRPEMIFNVQERKEIRDQYINDIIDIINANILGRIIIYYATHFSCEYLYNKLQENLTDVSIGYFHSGLCDNERETTMNNWTSNQIQIMVATSAFGMGINSSNIRVVIHVGAPMSITNLIQEAGRAGRDGNTATNVIFYSKKDVRINYSIVAEHWKTVSMIEEQRLIDKLDRAATKIFEVFYYCNSRYECRQQLIWQYQAWPNDVKPPIKKLLEVVEYLTQETDEQICPDDIVDVFRGGKTAKMKQKKWDNLPVYPTEKRKVLKTKELVQFALADLVVRGLVQEKIILRKTFEGSKGLSSSIVVIGVVPGAQANANIQTWYYFVK